MRWMNLEPIRQSQKEKNKYRILTHMYGIQKDSTDEPNRHENRLMDMGWREGEYGTNGENGVETYSYHV